MLVISEAVHLSSLTAEPNSCRLFGIDTSGQKAFIIDTEQATELPLLTIELNATPTDLALDRSGDFFYVALGENKTILKLNRTSGIIEKSATTPIAPHRIATGPNDRVFYVEQEEFSAIYSLNFITNESLQLTDTIYFEPDITTNADATRLYLGESIQNGSRLLRFDATSPELPQVNLYDFSNSGYTEPWPKRGIHLQANEQRIYFSERSYNANELNHVRGWIGDHVLTSTGDGSIVVTHDSFYDGRTFVRFGTRAHPGQDVCFSADGNWLFEFDSENRLLHQTAVATVVGAHRLGETLLPGGPLSRHRFTQILADPYRPVLYGLDAQQNSLVFIDRDTLVPIKALSVGSLPTHMALDASGDFMLIAAFGATEITRIDLDDQSTQPKDIFVVPSHPYRLAVDKVSNRVVYAEQDGLSALTLLNANTGAVIKRIEDVAFQPALVFDDSGRYLFAGESFGAQTELKRFDTLTNTFDPAGQAVITFSYPSRRIQFNNNSVFFGGYRFHGETLVTIGDFGEEIKAVTTNGTFAASNRRIYSTGNFAEVDGLPKDSAVITAHPNEMLIYQFDNNTGHLYVKSIEASD